MPSGLTRRQQTGNAHYITFSCHNRNPYLLPNPAKHLFLEILEETRKRYCFHVYGYVVMPEHVHLLVSEPPQTILGTALGVLKRNVSRQLTPQPFWLARYHDFNIYIDHKPIEKLLYTHRNPVARGLTQTPEAYPFSSFRHYAQQTPDPVQITRIF